MDVDKESKIIEAAQTIFLRYGYKRVTMQDIADEVGMSRPALYLVFSNKEDVFKATVKKVAANVLDELRHGLTGIASPSAQLRYAFEIWAAKPFEFIFSHPSAQDLINCSRDFAKEVTEEIYGEFERQVVEILNNFERGTRAVTLSSESIAHVLVGSVGGFKLIAKSPGELREMIGGLLVIAIQALR